MEFVFVVPRRALFPDCYPHGFTPFGAGGVDRGAFERALEEHGFFVERPRAEREPEWKQVIPYTIVTVGAGPDARVLLLARTARGGDARLHHKLSIGIGGHVEPPDALLPGGGRASNPVPAGSARELREELTFEAATEPRSVGLINDDSNPVGAVHVGVVQVLELEHGARVDVRERDLLEGRIVRLDELEALAASAANLETWSKLLVPHLRTLLAPEAPLPGEGARHTHPDPQPIGAAPGLPRT